ncbi:polyhydroxyalkanoate depolymerase [Pleomorphomonas diazotrophica]|uniref:Polyhydroxyalkanoate depolymerase n=1 Tax=Pleomorphomonas diazotrophica TaxID=1166257 RepID=A0A1I4SQT0_9HYPH|nr:polyhydroxyalkanoate depolymerase [Pleomorphomonas diazotrophica]SFM66673.1 poly(3-hydroxybutyrate) depolymerase [Pleomorphomonas diazotrophica]
MGGGGLDRLEDGVPYYHSYSGSEAAKSLQPPNDRHPEASGPSADLYARVARRYCPPAFNFDTVVVSGVRGPVTERVLRATPFWRLIAFDRLAPNPDAPVPSVLVLPPHAGHCPTLVRDTVAAFLPDHNVHVAGWADARHIPLSAGAFGFGEAVEAVAEMITEIGGAVHVVAVTEAGVVGIAAAALLEERGHPPATLTLVGGPVDCRADHAGLAAGAEARGLDWLVRAVIAPVPPPFEGAYREVFPGFFSLTGFLTRSLDRSFADHKTLFLGLVAGDGDGADGHRDFFSEFLAVMDVPAEFMLQWIEAVLIDRPFVPDTGRTRWSGATPPLAETPLMTVEAGLDSFGGGGQTHAAHNLTGNAETGCRYTEEQVGRFALFNGARWRASVFPRVADFIASHAAPPARSLSTPAEDLLALSGVTPALVARLNREGIYFVRQLARLDEAAASGLDKRLGTTPHPLATELGREARVRLGEAIRS